MELSQPDLNQPPSELAAQIDDLERRLNLKKWFGRSKVTDFDGKPMVVYHGTPNGDITSFDPDLCDIARNRFFKSKMAGFFTDRPGVAQLYAKGEHGAMINLILSIQKPLKLGHEVGGRIGAADARKVLTVMRAAGEERAANFYAEAPNSTHQLLVALDECQTDAVELLKRAGYDGACVQDGSILGKNLDVDETEPHTIWMVFDPCQIKSADKNSGQFNSEDPNIYR